MIRKKIFRKKWVVILADLLTICIVLSFLAESVFAKGNIHLGRLKVKPGITYKGEFNDNIYSAKSDLKSDFIHTLAPSIILSYTGSTPDNFFDAGYSPDFVYYSEYSDNNYIGHKPFISGGLKTPAGLYSRISNNYVSTEDPYGSATGYGIGDKTKRWNNALDFVLGWEFGGKFVIEPIYKNYIERFDLEKDKWQDRTDNIYGVSFFVKLTSKTSTFGQYRYTAARYDEQDGGVFGWSSTTSQNYKLNDYFIGARFEPGGKLSGEAKLGFGNKLFENRLDKDNNPYEDVSSWITETSVSFTATEKTNLSLSLQRSHKGSPDSDAASYIDTLIGLSFNQKLVNRISINLGAEWVNNDYQDEYAGKAEKSFNIYTGKGGLSYIIQDWFNASVNYKYKSKQASKTYESAEFEQNILSFQINVMF